MMLMIQLLLKSYPILILINLILPKTKHFNWDAEGLISYGDKLLYFRKTGQIIRLMLTHIPKLVVPYNAILESSYNANGLITGAETSANEKVIYLTG
jgi:hypothetical protein